METDELTLDLKTKNALRAMLTNLTNKRIADLLYIVCHIPGEFLLYCEEEEPSAMELYEELIAMEEE